MAGFEIKRCGREEYKQFLSTANDAFGYGAENEWFQKNCSHCTPYPDMADEEDIRSHVIAVSGGKVIGGVGAYELELALSEDGPRLPGERFTFKAAGIGQVCCLREYRGGGVMRAALTAALAESTEKGAVLAFLSGDRFRYGRYGFDFAGNELRLSYRRHRLAAMLDGAGHGSPAGHGGKQPRLRVWTPEDFSEISGMYTSLPSFVQRDERGWRKKLGRANYSWLIGDTPEVPAPDGGQAYMAFNNEDGCIVELCGQPHPALAMILRHMEDRNMESVTVCRPLRQRGADALTDALWNAASGVSVCPSDLAAVLAPDKVFETVAPSLARQGFGAGTPEERARLVRRVLRFCGQPDTDGLRPFVFWISRVDAV
ncbi:MAG: GNAT family N-acetyltransferase [Clostridiales bacterium]|nr:GNAT family N-acetyltransferase [Clostridiales bacterium]